MLFENTLEFALTEDLRDPLKSYRKRFLIPSKNGRELIYFTGNSLGLQPKNLPEKINQELQRWAYLGVEGHFTPPHPWAEYHKVVKKGLSTITGSLPEEVTAMGSLTANLHFLMVSFYQPIGKRKKILVEAKAFPSDQYAFESQVKFRGLAPDETIIELLPREGEYTLRTEDIIQKIDELGDELALICLGGVNYFTGQYFDLPEITKAGHRVGSIVGFDLAHTIGNIPLRLHDWNVDFAAWCSYKYLNSSPGGVGGVFVHQKHHQNTEIPRFAGWWGYDEATRFQMKKGFVPQADVEAWQLSNVPILLLAAHWASLEIFEEVGMENLKRKSEKLTGFLRFLIEDISRSFNFEIRIITPSHPKESGCQLSIIVEKEAKRIYEYLLKEAVVDWREPNVIRMAPVPLYNSFEEVYRFGELLKQAILQLKETSQWL